MSDSADMSALSGRPSLRIRRTRASWPFSIDSSRRSRVNQARIFERFERAVSYRHYGGFGVGLWIARELVEAHGGTIRVNSAVGEGASFTIDLPKASE